MKGLGVKKRDSANCDLLVLNISHLAAVIKGNGFPFFWSHKQSTRCAHLASPHIISKHLILFFLCLSVPHFTGRVGEVTHRSYLGGCLNSHI